MQFITIFALQRASQGQPQVVKARKHRNVLCDFLISFFPLVLLKQFHKDIGFCLLKAALPILCGDCLNCAERKWVVLPWVCFGGWEMVRGALFTSECIWS